MIRLQGELSRERQVDLKTKLFFGFGLAAYGVKDTGFNYFLLIYYNQVLGLPLGRVGLIIMIALVVDAISDPIVGYVSDNWHSKWGRRHPFMYAAALPVALAYLLLWNPPSMLTGTQLSIYLLVTAILVRTLITFYEIPSTSLIAELTNDYDERTSLVSYRFFFGWWGGLALAVLAFSVFLRPSEAYPVGVLNPEGYQAFGLAASTIMIVAILVSAVGTHSYIPRLAKPPPKSPFTPRKTLNDLRETFSNQSFRALFMAAILSAMAVGLSSALSLYINTYFWEFTSDEILVLVLGNFISAAVAVIAAPMASKHLEKKATAIAITLIAAFLVPVPLLLRVINFFPENGSVLLLPLVFVFNTINIALFICADIVFSAMIADVVEDNEVTTGRRSEGVYFAARSFVLKSVSGVGIFTASLVLIIINFPSDAVPGEVASEVLTRLALVYAPLLVLLYVGSVFFMRQYRISRESHRQNLHRLSG